MSREPGAVHPAIKSDRGRTSHSHRRVGLGQSPHLLAHSIRPSHLRVHDRFRLGFRGRVELFRQSLHAAQEALDAQAVPLLFVYLPQFARYRGGGVERHKDAVLATVRSLGIPVIDIDSVFTLTDPLDAFPNRLRGHYVPEAYRRVARAIQDWIERH